MVLGVKVTQMALTLFKSLEEDMTTSGPPFVPMFYSWVWGFLFVGKEIRSGVEYLSILLLLSVSVTLFTAWFPSFLSLECLRDFIIQESCFAFFSLLISMLFLSGRLVFMERKEGVSHEVGWNHEPTNELIRYSQTTSTWEYYFLEEVSERCLILFSIFLAVILSWDSTP